MMDEYFAVPISPSNKRAMAQMDALLAREGIERDRNLTYSAAIYDDDGQMIATGSLFENTLRCLAVDGAHRGEGLMAVIVAHLVQAQIERGHTHLFLYTKVDSAKFFAPLGFTEIARAKKDGYTIGGLNVTHIILQPLAQNAQFTPDSFKYICQVVNDPQCIAVRKDSPYQSTSEIIAAARKNPGKIRVGLVGPLSGHHLMFLDYGKKYPDAKLTSVFYKGAADQNAALLGGEIDMIFGNINDVMRSIDEFRVLNVAAEKRNDFLPDVPTLREAGIDMVSDIRRCFAAPKGIKPAELDAIFDPRSFLTRTGVVFDRLEQLEF